MPEGYVIRHSKAEYKAYNEQLAGENPEGPFEHQEQVGPDLTEAGRALAQESAKKFFDGLDSEQDELFLVSSNEARAIETANAYRQEASARKFEVLKPEHTRSEYAQQVGEGEIRVIDSLSLNTENLLRFLVFSGSEPTVNWNAVDEESKARWREARAVIEADNKGSWGANFAAHSEAIAQILPGVETAKQLYDTKFKHLLRLLKWADKKIEGYRQETGATKDVKILAFGHEDYLVQFLQDEMGEAGINNCEALQLETGEDGSVTAHFRDKTKTVESS